MSTCFNNVHPTYFRMAYFEVKCQSLSWAQLTEQVQSHYTHQAIQQAYVLIFGLDVLGNPYGLIKDFTQGFGDLFYEPFLVSITENLFKSTHPLSKYIFSEYRGFNFCWGCVYCFFIVNLVSYFCKERWGLLISGGLKFLWH